MDNPATDFELKKHAITKKVAEYFKTNDEDSVSVKDLKKIIKDAQKAEKIHQWSFVAGEKSIYFPTQAITAAEIEEILDNQDIERREFLDDEALLSFLRHEYVHLEVLLSTDGLHELYAKHLTNLEMMATHSEKLATRLKNKRKTKQETLKAAKSRQAQAESGALNPSSHKAIEQTTGPEYTEKCLVRNEKKILKKRPPPKKKKVFFFFGGGLFFQFFFSQIFYNYILFIL